MIRRRILLVEDEPGLRRTLKDLLVSSGYNVDTSQDGIDAQSRAVDFYRQIGFYEIPCYGDRTDDICMETKL